LHARKAIADSRHAFRSRSMFRNSRSSDSQQPSIGRPPTPPSNPAKTPFTLSTPPEVPAPKIMAATKSKGARQTPLPTIGRQGPTKNKTMGKASGKPNGSILSFFKKTDGPPQEDGLFVGGGKCWDDGQGPLNDAERESVDEDENRFNESVGSIKRLKRSGDDGGEAEDLRVLFGESPVKPMERPSQPSKGPFMEDSDSEDDADERPEVIIPVQAPEAEPAAMEDESDVARACIPADKGPAEHGTEAGSLHPPAIKDETLDELDLDEFKDFEGLDDFDEDPFEEGDEFRERKYMEEQARLEEWEDEKDYGNPQPNDAPEVDGDESSAATSGANTPPSCPICNLSLAGVSEQDVGVHVNNCLDGNPSPLPEAKKKPPSKKVPWLGPNNKSESTSSANQFKRPPRAPKPGQANPFVLGESNTNGGSAFNKLMSGHAEDAAWAEAAAAENTSRGKPSYQRTCPFYKILPGLFICVDAFRYGAVEGCQAYFLSHFHSDHYVGLTSHWSHGPIYCSKVTANLVRQQLRVDPKYVVDLEFDQPFEVPGTKGVKATMIPANHCPGSSLYLFEKVVGKKYNSEPKLQRILHCGDFRACKAHVEHPLLMPDVQCKITGKNKEQKIDVCYLDTTYLNPKYAFPSQESVIKACADMCVSLSKHTVDENDGWEQMKRQRAGEGMVKFVRKDSQPDVKRETPDEEDDATNDMKLERNPKASQEIIRTSSFPDEKAGRGRLLVVVGTYSIGKERICVGIAKAMNSKIYAPPSKQRIVAALEDPELNALMTTDPKAAQVHMTPLFEIRAETLDDYLKDYFPHFTRAVGFRPSGWNYRPPNSRFLESPAVQTVLNGVNWKSTYSMKDLVPQRGSTGRASCYGVPYSEHSSFRELTMFCCALRIGRVIPTVNVGSKKGRERMMGWCEKWAVERRKNGVFKWEEG
jgi:DNA cross-link repair 1A protein